MPKASNPSGKRKSKNSQWRRTAGPVVSLMREGKRVIIDFDYTPERVAAIKSIAGAKYNATEKNWSIPLAGVAKFLESKAFPTTARLSGLSPFTDADEPVAALDPTSAWEELRRDPFNVSEEALAGKVVDLVVRYDPTKKRLRLIPRIGSTAIRSLKRVRGALFSAYDSAYTLPVDQLAAFLKKMRDKQVSFAVSHEAGQALSISAPLRRQVLLAPNSASADQLADALLTPFIAPVPTDDGVRFRPCFFTSEQFALAFPGVRRQQGKIWLLDDYALLQFAGRMASLSFSVWLTKEVHEFVHNKREQFRQQVTSGAQTGALADIAAELLDVPLVWRTAQSGRGMLAIRLAEGDQFRSQLLKSLSEVTGSDYPDLGEALLVEIPDSKLQAALHEVHALCGVHDVPRIPQSQSFERLARETEQRCALRERSAYYTSLDDIDASRIAGLPLAESARLFPHQRVAIEWLRQTPYAFLGDDMGLGKTLSVLSYYGSLRATSGFSLLLVVCPNSLTRNWAREASNWFPGLRVGVLVGDKASKAWALRLLASGDSEYDLFVVNYEAVRLEYVLPELEKLAGSRKTLLCLDESQRVKNPTAKTFKAINQLAPLCERRVLLSGTPTPKDVTDLWAQMRILDGGQRLGKSFYKWLGTVAELGTEYSQYAVKRFHEHEVSESILRAQEIMLRRRKERVVDLPPKIFSIREVALSGTQAERYEEVREGLILRMRSISGEQFVREITNILEEYLRAVQIASNPRLIDPQWKGDPAKFLELDEIVKEVVDEQGQKLVVWTNYLGNVSELCERYKHLGAAPFSGEVHAADRERTVREFQDGPDVKILVAVPAAGGVGITLTAAQTAVYIDKTWNAEHWMQSVDRIHRIGQRGTVHVLSLLGCKVDEIIHWNLRRKEQNQARILGDDAESGKGLAYGITREELLEALDADPEQ